MVITKGLLEGTPIATIAKSARVHVSTIYAKKAEMKKEGRLVKKPSKKQAADLAKRVRESFPGKPRAPGIEAKFLRQEDAPAASVAIPMEIKFCPHCGKEMPNAVVRS